MINELFERELQNTSINDVSLADYVKENYKPIKPKTGHWIKTISENGITSAVRCSECGFEDNRYMLFKYCPNCGCRMVEEQESK